MPERATEPLFDTPRVRGVDDLLDVAWTVIANAPGWDTDNEWHDAAVRWRDRYHAYLDWTTSDGK
jgi:hypothetical protein